MTVLCENSPPPLVSFSSGAIHLKCLNQIYATLEKIKMRRKLKEKLYNAKTKLMHKS